MPSTNSQAKNNGIIKKVTCSPPENETKKQWKANENATISGPGGTKNTQNVGILVKTRTSTERTA